MTATIKLKRGAESNRGGVTPASGEPLVTTDTKELYIGDGVTPGGIPVGTIKTEGTPAVGDLAVFKGTTGKVVEPLTQVELLKNYTTTTDINAAIKAASDVIVNGKVAEAAKADDSDSLGARTAADYLTKDVITQSYQENDADKITSAAGVKSLFDDVTKILTDNVTGDTGLAGRVKANETRLTKLPREISMGSAAPSGGSSGDLYIQL